LDQAVSSADYVLFGKDRYQVANSNATAQAVATAIDKAVAQGAGIISTHTSVANRQALLSAAKHPNVKFITTGARDRNALTNVGAYSGKTDQQWFATGKLAARRADKGTKCIGMILPTPTKQIIRETNAFSRGVASFDPQIKVVIRWLGGTKDIDPSGQPSYSYVAKNYAFNSTSDGKLYREELLTAQLADMGCSLIGHRTDSQRVISFLDTIANRVNVSKPTGNHDILSMGVDVKDQCRKEATSTGSWIASCLGAPYWNWGPMYSRIFDEMNRNVWIGQETSFDFQVGSSAIMKFELSPHSVGITTNDVNTVFAKAANDGWEAVFKGPFSFNGQRDLDKDGQPDSKQNITSTQLLYEEEVDRMCWFVQGIWELPEHAVIDYASVIPAMVPYGPPISGQVTELNNTQDSQKKYGDVFTFITTKLSAKPNEVMSCPLNQM
jgi:basic membrane lipoprotein Med (substrate-binding protein (PBP1-ABC) superfamily)